MKRTLMLAFGVVAYLAFVMVVVYAVAFFGNVYAPRTIDSPAWVPFEQALLVNIALIALFGLQHSGMARPSFKRRISKIIPIEIERSTYVFFSSVATAAIMLFWQPMGGVVWEVSDPVAVGALATVYYAGWVTMIWSSFMICHFELFGLRQAWFAFRGLPYVESEFKTPSAYRVIRHPIYASWIIIFWASPVMTITHLVLAIGLTAYTVVGMTFEERDLKVRHPDYAQYCRKVPALLPSTRRHLYTRGKTIVDS